MSANNVVWVLFYREAYYVFYSGCFDNTPETPPPEAEKFYEKDLAMIYAFKMEKEHDYVEYGVCYHDPEDYFSPQTRVYDLIMRECCRNYREGYADALYDLEKGKTKTATEQIEYFKELYGWN